MSQYHQLTSESLKCIKDCTCMYVFNNTYIASLLKFLLDTLDVFLLHSINLLTSLCLSATLLKPGGSLVFQLVHHPRSRSSEKHPKRGFFFGVKSRPKQRYRHDFLPFPFKPNFTPKAWQDRCMRPTNVSIFWA